jgi:hypothetical protein
MVAGSSGVTNVQRMEKLLRHFVRKFFSLVSYKFKRKAISTNPSVQESRCDNQCLFIWQYDKFNIFCEGVGDAQNKFFISL